MSSSLLALTVAGLLLRPAFGLTRDEVESAFADYNVLRAGVDRA
ncbi:hypothetical protein ACFWAZ_37940 [Streptomyces collinus]